MVKGFNYFFIYLGFGFFSFVKMKYENLLIGDFIYSIGYISGQLGIENNRIDLLQQTPVDFIVGDLISKIGGRNFIMEFKRNKELLKTESQKSSKDFLLKHIIVDSKMLLISARSHFIAYGEKSDLLVSPYLFLNPIYKNNFGEPDSQHTFCKKLLLEEKIGVSKSEIEIYIDFLTKNSAGANTKSGGILVNLHNNRRPLIIDMSNGFDLKKKLEMVIGLEPKFEVNKNRGMEM